MVNGQEWVIDGNYMSTMPIRLAATDTVIVMDVSTLAALQGVLQRWWVHRSGQRGDGVFVRITPEFVRYVASFRRKMRPWVMAAIAEHAGHADVRVLPSRRAARRVLAAIADETSQGGRPLFGRGVGARQQIHVLLTHRRDTARTQTAWTY